MLYIYFIFRTSIELETWRDFLFVNTNTSIERTLSSISSVLMYCFLPEGRTTTRLVDDFIRSATTGQHYVKAPAKDAVQTPSKRCGGQEQSKYGSFTIIMILSFFLLVVWT